ncbi:MAG: diguanylate cyclase [Cyanobacteria bacterium P01_F01_bin.56]
MFIDQFKNIFHKQKSLRNRFLILNAIIFLATILPSLILFNQFSDKVFVEFGIRFANKQALYDRERNLLPLTRELALARRLAGSDQIVTWLGNENDPKLKEDAILTLENYADSFQGKSYFIASSSTGNYFFNDNRGTYTGKELRYVLNPEDPHDDWFFATLESNSPYHLNVEYDDKLDVTKVWINVLVTDDKNRKLGLTGTGIDVTDFIRNYLDVAQPGVINVLLDRNGAIQLHKNRELIDMASITKLPSEMKSIYTIIDSNKDKKKLKNTLSNLERNPDSVETLFVHLNGKRTLVGASYISELDWYSLTFIDIEEVLNGIPFYSIFILFGVALLVLMLLLSVVLHRSIIARVIKLDSLVLQMKDGEYKPAVNHGPTDEIGRLLENFNNMAYQVHMHTEELEALVEERTEALHRLTITDHLTKLLNRRGFIDCWERKLNLANREKKILGILIIDIDYFKKFNDVYGHDCGDQTLIDVAATIKNSVRSYDDCARWGGEEFVVLIYSTTDEELENIAENIRQRVKKTKIFIDGHELQLTISLGGYLCKNTQSLDEAITKADNALYSAKESGRDCYKAYTELKA